MRPVRALIFDFDGVIVESEHIKARAFEALYAEHGAEIGRVAAAYHEANGGISRRKKIRHLHRTHLGIELTDSLLEDLSRRFSTMVEDKVVACEGVPGALAVLDAQAGRRPMFVVSGTPHAELNRIIARRGLAHYFDEVHGSPPEKSPIVADLLARRGLDPRDVLFVGDAAADLRAARATGVRFLGVVANGRASPFPAGTPVIRDLTQLVL